MHQVAEDVWQIPLMPRNAVNAYLVGDVVIDAGTKPMGKKVVRAVAGHKVSAHALTHAHLDHAGGSRHVVHECGVPMWAPEGDVAAVESGRQVLPEGRLKAIQEKTSKWPAVPVSRHLHDGDELTAAFVVVDCPGHSPGHVAYWRESDRVLIAGDVWLNLSLLTTAVGLHHPPKLATVDMNRNHESQKLLAALRPNVVLFGHGPAHRDPEALARWTEANPPA
jgi:glyoxylase-like metal-dependent hydrolase (beta-lactamase superfamily II)